MPDLVKLTNGTLDTSQVSSAAKVIALAKTWIGASENASKSSAEYALYKHIISVANEAPGCSIGLGSPWCAATMCALFHSLGYDNLIKFSASCGSMRKGAINLGIWIETKYSKDNYSPKAGDLAIFTWLPSSPSGTTNHIGLVVENGYDEDGKISTIEGNTSSSEKGSQGNGGCVAAKKRKYNLVYGYIHPEYSLSRSSVSNASDYMQMLNWNVSGPYNARSTEPLASDLYYVPVELGGYNPFPLPMSNASYAWGRFCEIGQIETCNITRGLPCNWYMNTEDGLERNVAATLGSIMCFYKPGTSGYVCVVEEVYPDKIITSEYDENGIFRYRKRIKRYGSWDFEGYTFQGFIHNPMVDMEGKVESAMETFIRIAESRINDNHEWTCSLTGVSPNNSWSAPFVVACSKAAGSSLNIVIPNTTSCSAIGRVGVLRNMGEFLPSIAQNSFHYGQAGDIVLFRKHGSSKEMSIYMCDHVGIVIRGGTDSIDVVEGDCDGVVKLVTYNVHSKVISGYFRPNWSSIDGTTDSVHEYRSAQGLYTSGVSIEDACAREICFVNSQYQPSIQRSSISLSPINYTGMLANMYSVFAQSAASDATDASLIVDLWTSTVKSSYQDESFASTLIDSGSSLPESSLQSSTSTQQISTTEAMKACFNYLINKGFNSGATCGILANIYAESRFRTDAVGDSGTSFGICQWHNSRGDNMKKSVSDWANNLTGQLDFLYNELMSSYKSLFKALHVVQPTLEGAKQAADAFIRKFEVPNNVDEASIDRQAYAADIFNQLV